MIHKRLSLTKLSPISFLMWKGVENIIIPEFHGKTGAQSFEFAVDFGTSNTHIECRKDGGKIEPFTISEDERMIQPMSLNYGKDSDNPVQ